MLTRVSHIGVDQKRRSPELAEDDRQGRGEKALAVADVGLSTASAACLVGAIASIISWLADPRIASVWLPNGSIDGDARD